MQVGWKWIRIAEIVPSVRIAIVVVGGVVHVLMGVAGVVIVSRSNTITTLVWWTMLITPTTAVRVAEGRHARHATLKIAGIVDGRWAYADAVVVVLGLATCPQSSSGDFGKFLTNKLMDKQTEQLDEPFVYARCLDNQRYRRKGRSNQISIHKQITNCDA